MIHVYRMSDGNFSTLVSDKKWQDLDLLGAALDQLWKKKKEKNDLLHMVVK